MKHLNEYVSKKQYFSSKILGYPHISKILDKIIFEHSEADKLQESAKPDNPDVYVQKCLILYYLDDSSIQIFDESADIYTFLLDLNDNAGDAIGYILGDWTIEFNNEIQNNSITLVDQTTLIISAYPTYDSLPAEYYSEDIYNPISSVQNNTEGELAATIIENFKPISCLTIKNALVNLEAGAKLIIDGQVNVNKSDATTGLVAGNYASLVLDNSHITNGGEIYNFGFIPEKTIKSLKVDFPVSMGYYGEPITNLNGIYYTIAEQYNATDILSLAAEYKERHQFLMMHNYFTRCMIGMSFSAGGEMIAYSILPAITEDNDDIYISTVPVINHYEDDSGNSPLFRLTVDGIGGIYIYKQFDETDNEYKTVIQIGLSNELYEVEFHQNMQFTVNLGVVNGTPIIIQNENRPPVFISSDIWIDNYAQIVAPLDINWYFLPGSRLTMHNGSGISAGGKLVFFNRSDWNFAYQDYYPYGYERLSQSLKYNVLSNRDAKMIIAEENAEIDFGDYIKICSTSINDNSNIPTELAYDSTESITLYLYIKDELVNIPIDVYKAK